MREFISDERVAVYVAMRTGCTFTQAHTQLGIVRDGSVVCYVVFTHYSAADTSIPVASGRGAFIKIFLRRMGLYVWDELGCARISITTEQPAVVELVKRHGAKFEGVKRDAFGPGRDGMMLGLLASEWPFSETKRLKPSSR